ncbi:MAG: polysaccharide pyruvyl transferase CsaB [Tissierellia bacterium]|nr:polysaccharide pyruvyl transferase CsaB [Tissierellia bacterium]
MKILHLISGGDTGGAKTHLFNLVKNLQQYAEVKVICFIKDTFYDDAIEEGINIQFFQQKSRMDLSVVSKLVDEINSSEIDIVHCHGARANFIGRFLKKKIHVPMLTTIHSDYKLDFKGSLYKQLIFKTLNEFSLKSFSNFITISDDFKRMLVNRGFKSKGIYVAYNGIDTKKSLNFVGKREFSSRYGLIENNDCPVFCIAARLEHVKNVELFVEAAKKYLDGGNKGIFLIAGDGPDKEKLVKASEGYDNIIFLGFVKDPLSLFNYSDANVLTSLSESFPYVIMEAGLMKRPSIASNVGGIDKIVINDETGMLIDVNDIEGLVDSFIKFHDNPEKTASMGINMFNLINDKYSAEEMAKKHKVIYDSILSGIYAPGRRLLMSGYFGFQNSGDDAILKAMVNDIEKTFPENYLEVLTNNPDLTKKQVNVDGVQRFSWIDVWKALGRCDMLISGGGSLLQDITSYRSLWYYLAVITGANIRGKDVYIYANGIGPITNSFNRYLARKVLDKVDYITVRDESSRRFLEELKVKNPIIEVTSDPVFSLKKADSQEVEEIWAKEKLPLEGRFIGIALRPWKDEKDSILSSSLRYILDKHKDIKLILIPFHIPVDRPYQDTLVRGLIEEYENRVFNLKEQYDASTIIGLFSKMDFAITMRLHAMIYAAMARCPVLPISYDPKIIGISKELGLNYYLEIDNLDLNSFIASFDTFVLNKDSIKMNLDSKASELKELSLKNLEPIKLLSYRNNDVVNIMGVYIQNTSLENAMQIIDNHIDNGKGTMAIYTPNTEIVMAGRKDPDMRMLINSGDLVTADGIGLVIASKIRKKPLKERVTGFDISIKLLEYANEKNLKLFFLGGAEGVAKDAAEAVIKQYPNISDIKYHNGYFKGVPTGTIGADEEIEIVKLIEKQQPDIIFVGLGYPKQEIFISEYKKYNIGKLMIGNGGVLNILAGRAQRAPEWMIKYRLEWLYRLYKEPRRIVRQLALPHFLWRIVIDKKSVK